MRPFFLLLGGKWKAARRYGTPQHDLVVEPFAGGAGYSTYWEPKRVILVERDPLIANLWKYLTRVSAKEILQLPTQIDSLSELPASICQESKWLTCQSRSNWARSQQYRHLFWGPQIQARIASQVDHVRHWQIVEGDYRKAPNVTAHWFIDPPYILAGQHYEHNSDSIDNRNPTRIKARGRRQSFLHHP